MHKGFILHFCVFELFVQTFSLPMHSKAIGESSLAQKSVKIMKKDQQNFVNEMVNRKKRHSPFFFKSLEFQDSTFEKQEREKKQKQKEMSLQLRKNAKFNNGLRWMGYQRKEHRFFEMVTNSTGKDFNESNQLGLKKLCEDPNKKNIRHLIEKCHQFSLKKLYHFKEASTRTRVARVRRVPMFLRISGSNVMVHSTRKFLRSNIVKPTKTSPRWVRLI